MQRCACIVNWRDNKRLQTLWSGTGVDAWRQWERAQEGWPGAIESRYSRTVSAASLEETLLWALSAMAGLHTLLAGTWVWQKTDSLKKKYGGGMCWTKRGSHWETRRQWKACRKTEEQCWRVWSITCPSTGSYTAICVCLVVGWSKLFPTAWNKPKKTAWARKMERWTDEIKTPCD